MNKSELLKKLSEQCCLPVGICKVVLDNFYCLICDSLRKGEEINFYGVGKFVVKRRAERLIYGNLGQIFIPPKSVPVFKLSKNFRNIIN